MTEPSTRHSLLIKQKYFAEPGQRLASNSRKLTDPANVQPDETATRSSPIVLREDDDEGDAVGLQEIPLAPAREVSGQVGRDGGRRDLDAPSEVIDLSKGDHMADRDTQFGSEQETSSDTPELGGEPDDKKKLFMFSSYDGFSIYGRILCLIVKHRQGTNERLGANDGQAMMENWIRSTQLDPEEAE